MRYKQLINSPIFTMDSGERIGTLYRLIVNRNNKRVRFLLINKPSYVNIYIIPFARVVNIGEHSIIIDREDSLIDVDLYDSYPSIRAEDYNIIDQNIFDSSGEVIGKMVDYTINKKTGQMLTITYFDFIKSKRIEIDPDSIFLDSGNNFRFIDSSSNSVYAPINNFQQDDGYTSKNRFYEDSDNDYGMNRRPAAYDDNRRPAAYDDSRRPAAYDDGGRSPYDDSRRAAYDDHRRTPYEDNRHRDHYDAPPDVGNAYAGRAEINTFYDDKPRNYQPPSKPLDIDKIRADAALAEKRRYDTIVSEKDKEINSLKTYALKLQEEPLREITLQQENRIKEIEKRIFEIRTEQEAKFNLAMARKEEEIFKIKKIAVKLQEERLRLLALEEENKEEKLLMEKRQKEVILQYEAKIKELNNQHYEKVNEFEKYKSVIQHESKEDKLNMLARQKQIMQQYENKISAIRSEFNEKISEYEKQKDDVEHESTEERLILERRHKEAINQYEDKIDELTKGYNESLNLMKKYKSELDQENKDRIQLENQQKELIKQYEDKIISITTQHNNKISELEHRRHELESNKSELEKSRYDLESVKRELEKEHSEFNKNKEELEGAKLELLSAKEAFEESRVFFENEKTRLNELISSKDEEISNLKKALENKTAEFDSQLKEIERETRADDDSSHQKPMQSTLNAGQSSDTKTYIMPSSRSSSPDMSKSRAKGADRLKELLQLQKQRSMAMSNINSYNVGGPDTADSVHDNKPPSDNSYRDSEYSSTGNHSGGDSAGNYSGSGASGYGSGSNSNYRNNDYNKNSSAEPKKRYSIDDYLDNQKSSIMGKKITKNIYDVSGNLLVPAGTVVTEEIFEMVKSRNKDSIIEMVMYSE